MACVFDATAIVALALDEPAAEEVEGLLRRGGCRISAANVCDAIDQLKRVRGIPDRELIEGFETLAAEAYEVVPVEQRIARRAAELRGRHYDRRDKDLSLADCMALATVADGDALATSDGPLAVAARAEGFEVIALPSSTGARP